MTIATISASTTSLIPRAPSPSMERHKMARLLPKKDAVIIGLGWTGSIMAQQLTDAGLNVVAIERGPWRDTATDFNIAYMQDELRYGVGGAGVHWNGQTWRFWDSDFSIRTHLTQRYGVAKLKNLTLQDWGVTWNEIEH